MGLDEPVVPPFPISDYGTACMGAIAALAGLLHRARRGGSWHGKVSLLHYDLLLFKAGLLPDGVQRYLRQTAGDSLSSLCHSSSVEQVSGAVLQQMRVVYPDLVDSGRYLTRWDSACYASELSVVAPVVEVDGLQIGFRRPSRANGWDEATWDFADEEQGQCRTVC
ncbi:hypothetical protein CDD82_6197 [Ophiocordyceps australis]|uniref:CoA-transferase family III n=1 Tax=Ophiocordyceps australis TaxID=1399860 RepID=A0A2C5YXF7_9HYPO|nr:hypothetical protein CDD82_6197 [Ophiocordyceps australis]